MRPRVRASMRPGLPGAAGRPLSSVTRTRVKPGIPIPTRRPSAFAALRRVNHWKATGPVSLCPYSWISQALRRFEAPSSRRTVRGWIASNVDPYDRTRDSG